MSCPLQLGGRHEEIFTINALYYSIEGFTVLDYTNGIQDLADKKIRIIGDAVQRCVEDPVRMLLRHSLSSQI